MGSPKVTVIVPAFNSGLWLSECLQSIQQQTFRDFVCRIYDDGSTDNTLEIGRRFELEDNRFSVIHSDTNIGTPKVVAKAYSDVSSEFFCQVDSDDKILPSAIEDLIKVYLGCHNNIGVVYSNYSKIDSDGNILPDDKHFINRCLKSFSLKRMQNIGFCAFQFRLIKTELYRMSRELSDSIETGEDFDLVMKLSEVCQFIHVRKKLYLYRQHQSQTSKNKESILEHTCRMIMDESKQFIQNADYALVIRYFGPDHIYSLRRWVTQVTDTPILIAVITDIPEDEDLIECANYSHHSIKIIKERDGNIDYGNLVSKMAKFKQVFDINEDVVPNMYVLQELIQGFSIPVYTLEPRTSFLLQTGMVELEAVKDLDDEPVESLGNGIRGSSFLCRLTREQHNGT